MKLVEHLVKEHTCIFCQQMKTEKINDRGLKGTSKGGWDRYGSDGQKPVNNGHGKNLYITDHQKQPTVKYDKKEET